MFQCTHVATILIDPVLIVKRIRRVIRLVRFYKKKDLIWTTTVYISPASTNLHLLVMLNVAILHTQHSRINWKTFEIDMTTFNCILLIWMGLLFSIQELMINADPNNDEHGTANIAIFNFYYVECSLIKSN
jgi:hypothetical protein